MTGRFQDFPERPPSEAEWEDLLVRFELGPRALRDAIADARWTVGEEELLEPLAMLLAHEALTTEALVAMREGRTLPGDGAGVEGLVAMDTPARVEEFAAMRSRNFAAVQRRGIEVWDWRTEIAGHPVTAFQLLQAGVALDGAVLAAIRAAHHEG